jgi:hypothetical protein
MNIIKYPGHSLLNISHVQVQYSCRSLSWELSSPDGTDGSSTLSSLSPLFSSRTPCTAPYSATPLAMNNDGCSGSVAVLFSSSAFALALSPPRGPAAATPGTRLSSILFFCWPISELLMVGSPERFTVSEFPWSAAVRFCLSS